MTCVGVKNKTHTHSPAATSACHSTQSCLENVMLLTLIFPQKGEVKITYFPLSACK